MVDPSLFQEFYSTEPPPWDIGRAQPAFVRVADRVVGRVLDAGCGTGENALFFAARGLVVTGFDFVAAPIEVAKQKARERGLSATFVVRDALTLAGDTARFDSVIDSGLFHVFSDADRKRYVEGLAHVVEPGGRLFLLSFSDEEPGTQGPRRISKAELEKAFARGWLVESIERTTFEVRPEYRENRFSGVDPKAWFMIARRVPSG
jgi:cyclopropane fatty-acyl-phospholipid synthase-like methyltransferase